MDEQIIPGKYPHIEWLDLNQNGVLVECAIMKREQNGDVYFFPLASLDAIDRNRLFKVVNNRNAHMYELWDLMGQITLNNGENALKYFQQLVKVRTSSGVIVNVAKGRHGMPQVQIPPETPKVKTKEQS